MQNHIPRIAALQQLLENNATPKKKAWLEEYMKGVIPFRGLGMTEIRVLVDAWIDQQNLKQCSKEEQLELALALFREPIGEDKLAGILYLQYHLYDQFDWEFLLKQYGALYQENLIFDWNTCDWFCVRVLGPTIALQGMDCGEFLTTWRTSPQLWQARSSVVGLIKVVSNRNYDRLIQTSCETLIDRPERFAKTSVGWILREVSKHHEPFTRSFIEEHLASFSIESLRNATKYFDASVRETYVKRCKQLKGMKH